MSKARAFVGFIALGLALAGTGRAVPSDDEQKQLAAAGQSFKDGAFDLCNERVTALLKKYPKSELVPPAELLQARALYQLGRDADALAALNLPLTQVPDNLQADFLFWQAESLLALSRWPEAEQRYRALLALKDPADHADAANLGLAWSLFKQGREAEAFPLIATLTKDKGTAPAGQQAQLLLAKIELAKTQFKDAITGLEGLLGTKPAPGLAFETDYWLGETYAANGQPDKAAEAYRRITDDPKAFPKLLVASANLGLGRAEDALHQNDQAVTAYQQAYKLTEDETARQEVFQAYLASARAAGGLPEAISALQEFAKSSVDSAPGALFAIGVALADNGEDDKAIGTLESLLVAYGKSSWVPAAQEQLGRLYARTGKSDQAMKAWQSCIDTATDPALARTARAELGGALFSAKDYAGAAAQFLQVGAGTDAAAEDGSFNYLLAEAYLNKPDVFAKAEADFLKRFPQSAHLKAIALAEARLLIAANKTDDAKAVYEKALALPGAGADQLDLLRALADLQYQTNDLEGTLATCQKIVAQFPNDSLAAAQRSVLVSYELKKISDDQAEQALTALAEKYDKSPGAAKGYFVLGEFYFYRGNYVKAQDAFQQLTTAYPSSDYSDYAYFFAGRAAAAHYDYSAARALLAKVPDNSPYKPEARLWEGRVDQQQLNFAQAETIYDSVLATEKSGPRFVEASLWKGQCLFEMGAKDATFYPQALAAFDPVMKDKDATVAERNEAAVRSAKCLEKMGKTDDAMADYLDVLYGRVGGDEASGPAAPDFSWQVEGGWQAARIREGQKDWRGAIEIYRRLEQIGGVHQQEFHDLVNKLRRDNYIYE
jgi:tetratricopeptide (TPR) repeat protein